MFFVVLAMLLFTGITFYEKGVEAGKAESVKIYEGQLEKAIWVTRDDKGVWLGSEPGAKEAPLYNHLGQQVGKPFDPLGELE